MSNPASGTIESVLHENRVFPPNPALARQANISGMDAYRALCAAAEKDYSGFWAGLAREHLLWKKPFTQSLDDSKAPFFRWFAERAAFDGRTVQPDCVWFLDLRFVNPGRDWVPFRFGACRDAPGAPWRAYERMDGGRGRAAMR